MPAILRSIAVAVDNGVEAVAIGNGSTSAYGRHENSLTCRSLACSRRSHSMVCASAGVSACSTSGRSGASRIEELAARYGIGSRMVRPVAAEVTVPTVVEAFADESVAAHIRRRRTPPSGLGHRGADVVMVASRCVGCVPPHALHGRASRHPSASCGSDPDTRARGSRGDRATWSRSREPHREVGQPPTAVLESTPPWGSDG